MSRADVGDPCEGQRRGEAISAALTDDDFQRRSSAVTLSDLELLVYPELPFALVLANIMSPRIWRWRDDPWFSRMDRLSTHRRIMRLKQYIVDHYAFNLDLHTWGLTTRENELARFSDRASRDDLCRLSPFFGCPGDRHYFDVDIRTAFGLEHLPDDVIPYWKTETVEAMDAFRHRRDDGRRAGECVSLAALYAAALYIVARVPLDRIYIMITPLHCQAFVDVGEGMLTNNRRVVTRRMWFNGSELSRRARRSLENEQIVLVAHQSGFAHTLYDATMAPEAFARLETGLATFLRAPLTAELFGSFLRQCAHLQPRFQLRCGEDGHQQYIPLEAAFAAEAASSDRLTDGTRNRLLSSLDGRHRYNDPLLGRISLDDIAEFLTTKPLDLEDSSDRHALAIRLTNEVSEGAAIVEALARFCKTAPQLPGDDTHRNSSPQSLELKTGMERADIISRLQETRSQNQLAEMAFYVYRDLNQTDPAPFVWAAVRRNPVSVEAALQRFGAWRDGLVPDALMQFINNMPDTSIYDGAGRLAQPDEVWNFARGDGIEKALLLANVARHAYPTQRLSLVVQPGRAVLRTPQAEYGFSSHKTISEQEWVVSDDAPATCR